MTDPNKQEGLVHGQCAGFKARHRLRTRSPSPTKMQVLKTVSGLEGWA